MKTNAPNKGKKTPDEVRQKLRDAKRRFFEAGGKPARLDQPVSPEECAKRSINTKRMWADGKFSYGDGKVMRSKVERALYERILTAFPDAQHSRWLTLNGTTYVFDVFIPSLKTFIEVNGNYWHLNPRIYEADHHDKHRDVIAHELWERDATKRHVAENTGYRVITVWEDEATAFDPLKLVPT
jgi:G:T-mismatch repair DNA endonuclease (very short patch repair protein)